jgi:hypothetical protein
MPITVKRVSDNSTFTVANADEHTKVGDLKNEIKAHLPPKNVHGTVLLVYNTVKLIF